MRMKDQNDVAVSVEANREIVEQLLEQMEVQGRPGLDCEDRCSCGW